MDNKKKIKMLIGNEDLCMKEYLQNGPDGLMKFLGITDKTSELWINALRYFVYEKDMIFKCAIQNIETLQQIMVSVGPFEMRKVMGIDGEEFDAAFESVMDVVGISCRAFYKFIVSHKVELEAILVGEGPQQLRAYLSINDEKFNNLWEAVMDLLVADFSKKKMDEQKEKHQGILLKLMPKLEDYLKGKGLI